MSTTTRVDQAEVPDTKEPCFKPYECAHKELSDPKTKIPSAVFAELASKASDIGHGVASILQMIEINMMLKDCGDRPLMDTFQEGRMMRLAIRAASMLGDESDEVMEQAFNSHMPEGRKAQKARMEVQS